MQKRAFAIFSWNEPFLPHLQEYICSVTNNMPGRSVIIVPHNRPRRYLIELFSKSTLPRPVLLPRICTMDEMIGIFRAQNIGSLHTGTILDRVAFLHRAVQRVSAENMFAHLCEHFLHMDMAQFFPWGLKLSALFEECFGQYLDVQSIPYAEEEVSPQAAALLGALGSIAQQYQNILKEENQTSAGFDAYMVAQALQQGTLNIPSAFCPELSQYNSTSPDATPHALSIRHVFIAGLSTLTQTEHILLQALWHEGAHICLHTDPNIIAGTQGHYHWACSDHAQWLRRWQASTHLVNEDNTRKKHKTKRHFVAGYDTHSQLLAVQKTLQEKTIGSTAVVLTHTGLLMPMLHHIPNQDFNVSMGYPLEKSPLFRFVETIFRVQTSARQQEDGTLHYYWRNLLQCLRHPYVQMLQTEATTDMPAQEVRTMLQHMEELLRGGTRFATVDALASQAMANSTAAQRQLLQDIIHYSIHNFAHIKTPLHMAKALGQLCDMLLQYGNNIWEQNPLDAESLYRLIQHVIPTLKSSALATMPFPPQVLFAISRQLIQAERVPFEADPITGLQILGMLETRLLHFDRLLIVDATDDILPGFSAQDALLPEALRTLLGLPTVHGRERVVAHTLYRLMASATEVHFFWQEGVQASALFEGKKSRSRFVDACLWEEEQKHGELLHSGTDALHSMPCPVYPIPHMPSIIQAEAHLRQAVHAMLVQGISPTHLDTYIKCPQRFIWKYIYKLAPLTEVNEGDDPAAVGQLLHMTLQQAYKPWIGRTLQKEDISTEILLSHWEKQLTTASLCHSLPPDSLIMLRTAVPVRLVQYLEHQPESTHIVALEQSLHANIIGWNGTLYTLNGILDRIDRRTYTTDTTTTPQNSGLVILDYKTGSAHIPTMKVWEDMDLWQAIQLWTPNSQTSAHVLDAVATAFPSLQLPCYSALCQQNYTDDVLNAAYITLGSGGEETWLLADKVPDATRLTVLSERIPQLLAFVLSHLDTALYFAPREGKHCEYCPYGALCHGM